MNIYLLERGDDVEIMQSLRHVVVAPTVEVARAMLSRVESLAPHAWWLPETKVTHVGWSDAPKPYVVMSEWWDE